MVPAIYISRSRSRSRICKCLGWFLLSSYKTAFKQQLNGQRRWKMRWKVKSLICFCCFPVQCFTANRGSPSTIIDLILKSSYRRVCSIQRVSLSFACSVVRNEQRSILHTKQRSTTHRMLNIEMSRYPLLAVWLSMTLDNNSQRTAALDLLYLCDRDVWGSWPTVPVW